MGAHAHTHTHPHTRTGLRGLSCAGGGLGPDGLHLLLRALSMSADMAGVRVTSRGGPSGCPSGRLMNLPLISARACAPTGDPPPGGGAASPLAFLGGACISPWRVGAAHPAETRDARPPGKVSPRLLQPPINYLITAGLPAQCRLKRLRIWRALDWEKEACVCLCAHRS